MKPTRARRRGHCRVPAFAPVRLRSRKNGWTPMKQAAFLAALAVTGSVRTAARQVRMSRETAYRLRRRSGGESFAAAWDAVTRRGKGPARKVTPDEVAQRAIHGLLKPRIFAGRHVATVWKPDNSALLRHMAQLDRARPLGDAPGFAEARFTPRTGSTSAARDRRR